MRYLVGVFTLAIASAAAPVAAQDRSPVPSQVDPSPPSVAPIAPGAVRPTEEKGASPSARRSMARNPDRIPDWIARALRHTERASSSAQEPTPTRGWSTPRLLLGVGLAAFGAYWAVHERRCRGTGALSSSAPGLDRSVAASPDSSVLYANLHIGYGNARDPSVTRRGNVCDVDWAFDSQEIWTDNSIPGRPLTYADPDSLQRWALSNASSAPGPPTDVILQHMRGSFAPEEYIPSENVYVGIAAAAAGGIVAAFFSRTDAPIDITPIPAGARLSINFGF
ncbi:MAG: hypothetical protein F4Z04_06270 [Acidobacteria bacterium]|nr:hypothetical protein [Acidobacteriota bacterium]